MSLFKFKKAKVMVGDFDPDDGDEWTLLIKPQIQDVTLFVHFHKLWNQPTIQEVKEVEADDENGIAAVEPVEGQYPIPVLEVYAGFVKEGKFIVDKNKPFSFTSNEAVKKDYVLRLQKYINEGFGKDWDMYKNDVPEVPNYHGAKQLASRPMSVNPMPGQSNTGLTTKKLLKHIMLGKPQVINTP